MGESSGSTSRHPYRHFWETEDLRMWEEALAPDVVIHSPILSSPFLGRAAAVELFGVLLEALDDFELGHESADSGRHVFSWSAMVSGRKIEGCDFIAMGDDDRISEITVLIRPLVGIGAFASAMGPPLAARRSVFRAVLARVMSVGLRGFLALADATSTWLVREKRGDRAR